MDDDDDDWGELDEDIDYNKKDLNKLSRSEVEKHKKEMDVEFNKNALKPGDAGFVYEKEVDFVPGNEKNEFDETSEDDYGFDFWF